MNFPSDSGEYDKFDESDDSWYSADLVFFCCGVSGECGNLVIVVILVNLQI